MRNPGLTDVRPASDRMKSPAAITRSVASAIWNPTTDRPTAWRRLTLSAISVRKAANAGANPKSRPVTIVIAAVNPRTCQSKCGVYWAIAQTRFRAAEEDGAAGRRIREPVPAVGGGRHERRLRQRDNDRRRLRGQCASGSGEALGIDADDRNGDIVDLDRPSDRGWRPREFAIPEGVADHRYRGAAWHVVGRTNLATDLRPDAEHLVVVAPNFGQNHGR